MVLSNAERMNINKQKKEAVLQKTHTHVKRDIEISEVVHFLSNLKVIDTKSSGVPGRALTHGNHYYVIYSVFL